MRTEIETTPGAKSTLRPVHDYIVVLPIKGREKTAGGLFLPNEVKDKPKRQGVVVSTGPGNWNPHKFTYDPVSVKPQDRVLFGSWAGTDVELAGKELLLVHDSDILAVIVESSNSKK